MAPRTTLSCHFINDYNVGDNENDDDIFLTSEAKHYNDLSKKKNLIHNDCDGSSSSDTTTKISKNETETDEEDDLCWFDRYYFKNNYENNNDELIELKNVSSWLLSSSSSSSQHNDDGWNDHYYHSTIPPKSNSSIRNCNINEGRSDTLHYHYRHLRLLVNKSSSSWQHREYKYKSFQEPKKILSHRSSFPNNIRATVTVANNNDNNINEENNTQGNQESYVHRHSHCIVPSLSSSYNNTTTTKTTINKKNMISILSQPKICLPLLVFIDMFAVSLVLPLLFEYYKQAGIHSSYQRELVSSIFSLSQIVGGIILTTLMNANIVQRRTILFISFAGSALSYGLLLIPMNSHSQGGKLGIIIIIISRIIVGLVKQTITITTAMLTQTTNNDNRVQQLGRLNATMTIAWIIGPSVGALLFKYVHSRAPLLLSCALFVINIIIADTLLPSSTGTTANSAINDANNSIGRSRSSHNNKANNANHSNKINDSEISNHKKNSQSIAIIKEQKKGHSSSCGDNGSIKTNDTVTGSSTTSKTNISLPFFLNNLKSCFFSSNKQLGSIISSVLLFTWITRTTDCNNLGNFYEDMYKIEPYQRGYISSYQQLLNFLVQSIMVGPIIKYLGGEKRAVVFCCIILSVKVFIEIKKSLPLYLCLICPIMSLSISTISISLQTLVTHHAANAAAITTEKTAHTVSSNNSKLRSSSSLFGIIATLDILKSTVSASVPFYRTILFSKVVPKLLLQTTSRTAAVSASTTSLATTTQMMIGDPDPIAWIIISTIHWFATAAITSFLLLPSSSSNSDVKPTKESNIKLSALHHQKSE